ncbi:type IVB secretion system apparatus protein IcmL/DotI [Brucella pseudogrignonensis]
MTRDYGRIESVLLRAEAYRFAYYRMSLIALTLTAISVVSVIATVVLATSRPAPVYFATNSDGGITRLIPLDEPALSPASVANFATEAATRALTYSFSNYRAEFEDMKPYFAIPAGWNSFVDALNRSGQIDLVKKQRLNTTAIAQRAVILREGLDAAGSYQWIVQLPLRVTYQSASQITGQNFMVTLTLHRMPTHQYPRGIAVFNFNAAPGA